MSRFALYLLGPPRIELEGEPVHIGRRKALALLAYLAVEPGHHSRDALATLFWPDYDQSGARGRLRRTLSTLSRTIGPGWFTADRQTIGLYSVERPEPVEGRGFWLDVRQFRERLAACETHGHPSEEPCPDCLAHLTEAAELFRDDFMSGFTLPDSLEFDEWQRYQAARLRDELASVLERLVAFHSSQADYEPAIACARRWLELDPLSERAHQQLMDLYAQAGRHTAALRQYRACMRVLEQELGVPPSAETTALYERIRSERTRPVAPQVGAPAPTRPDRPLPAFLSDEAAPPLAGRPVFVARERELARLDGYLQAALAGQGQAVFVTGGPGRGKTALMREFARRATAKRANLLIPRGACNAYSGAGDPYHPFRQVLAMLTGDVEGRWAAGVISTEHAQRLWATLPLAVQTLFDHDPHLIDVFLSGQALLSRALSATGEVAEWLARLREWVGRERGDRADLKPQYLFEQYANTLCDLAVEHPLVLLLDDLQWVDSPSASLLFHLGRRLAEQGGRVLVVGAYRPEEVALGRDENQHPLESVIGEFKRRFGNVQVDLAQADQEMGRRFVDAFLDSEPNRLGQRFREMLHARTAGHPLFTVELLRTMQERGDLAQDDGAWVERPTLDWEALPARVEAVIEARVGRLNEDLRDLLAVASVEGEVFTAEAIARVLHIPEWHVLRALSSELGLRHRLVGEADEIRLEGGFLSRYQFAHALFQTYVYNRLSPGERRLLHGEVGAALEALYDDQTDQIVSQLARHCAAAAQLEKAIEYAARAGKQARLAYANEEAITHFQHALELLGSSLTRPARHRLEEWRLEALRGLGQAYFAAGQSALAEEFLQEAIALGKELGVTPSELVPIYFWLGEVVFWQGRYDDRLRIGEEGLALLRDETASSEANASAEAVESVEVALMYQLIAGAHQWIGNLEGFYELADRLARFIRRLPYTEELRPVYENIVMAQWGDKDPGEMIKWLRIFEEQAAEHHDLTAVGNVYMYVGLDLAWRGDLRGGILKLQHALAMCAKIGDTRYESHDCQLMGESLLYLGELKKAELYAHRALETAEATGFKLVLARAYWDIGRIALCQGALKETVEACQTALGLFRQTGEWWKERWTICTLGRARLAQGDYEEALRRFQEAVAMPSQEYLYYYPRTLPAALSGLEEAYADTPAFRAFCRRFRETHPQVSDLPMAQWFLEPANVAAVRDLPLQHDQFTESLSRDCTQSADWVWHDLYNDCSFWATAHSGLEICAANGRDLWDINLSAPRLLRTAPEHTDWAVQATCGAASADKPSIGGLLLWKDQENYLRLDRGTAGKYEIAFHGCLGNQDLIIGRGQLTTDPSERVFLRLERIDERVNALCSADGAQWFTVGHIEFPLEDPIQIGLHAIGNIDRTIYHGAYPDGTAIRFESFRVWELER